MSTTRGGRALRDKKKPYVPDLGRAALIGEIQSQIKAAELDYDKFEEQLPGHTPEFQRQLASIAAAKLVTLKKVLALIDPGEGPHIDKDTPEGTDVAVIRDNGVVWRTKTRSAVFQLGGGDWVVLLEGMSGSYDVTRCRALDSSDEGCFCQGCGKRYKVDFLVPDALWAKIGPKAPTEGGLLCGPCITSRVEALGEFGAFECREA